jgi:hypothetical protein
MDTAFTGILQKLIAEQGKDALIEARKCKAFINDYTGSDYKKERRFIVQAVEAGVAKAIAGAGDLASCKKAQVRELEEEFGLAPAVAADVVDTLALVLRGDTSKTQTAPPAVAPPPPQPAPEAEPKDLKYRVIASGTKIEITGFKGKTEVIIPPYIENLPVTHIGEKAFHSKKLTAVTIPNTVTHIMGFAFASNSLTSVIIPDSVTDIVGNAFYGNRITSVTILNSMPKKQIEGIFGKGVTVKRRR